jgi:hypothetical protein
MKYLKKFNENNEFESRLDGSSKSRSDYEKRGSFINTNEPIIKNKTMLRCLGTIFK